jgi:O-antigen biosynthesis protein WbqV
VNKYKRIFFNFLHDLAAAALAYALSMYLRVGEVAFSPHSTPWLAQMTIFAFTCLAVFFATGVYKGVWRYVSVRDLAVILRAVTIAVLVFVPVSFVLTRLEGMPRSVPIIVWFVLMAFMGGSRLFVRLLKEGRLESFWNADSQPRTKVLLVGAGDESEHFIRATLNDKDSPYQVVGVLDDKGTRVGREIHTIAVLGQMNELSRVLKELKARGAQPSRLILTKSASRVADFETFLSEAEKMGLALSRLPSMTDLRDGLQPQAELRPIALEDLLGRPETVLDQLAIASLIQDKRVLVTGAGGTIGSELSLQIAALGPAHLTLIDNGEFNLYSIEMAVREKHPMLRLSTFIADVRDKQRIDQLFTDNKPQIIFHAAALKHVPIAEANIRETVLTNVMGTRNVADAASACASDAMVLISTDKAVRPTSVMGATKRVAEHYCQALDQQASRTRFLTVRFGNVLGSTGSVVPRFREQLAKGGPLTVTHPDITRYFMTVREAVELVLQASAYAARQDAARGRIMVLDMGKPIKIADLARQMIRLAGLKPDEDIKIAFTGLRPGEKLYEELFSDSEKLSPSGADGVLLAAAAPQPLAQVQVDISNLVQDAGSAASEDALLRKDIAVIVPEFNSAAQGTLKKAANS